MSRDGLSNPVTSIPDYAAAMLSVCSAAVIIDDVPPSVLTRSVASPPTPPPPLKTQPRLRIGVRGVVQHREPLSRIDNVLQRHKTRTASDEFHASETAASKLSSVSAAAAGSGLGAEAREVLELELRMERLEYMCKQQEQQQQRQRFGLSHASSDQSLAAVSLNPAAAASADTHSHVSPLRTPVKSFVRYFVLRPNMSSFQFPLKYILCSAATSPLTTGESIEQAVASAAALRSKERGVPAQTQTSPPSPASSVDASVSAIHQQQQRHSQLQLDKACSVLLLQPTKATVDASVQVGLSVRAVGVQCDGDDQTQQQRDSLQQQLLSQQQHHQQQLQFQQQQQKQLETRCSSLEKALKRAREQRQEALDKDVLLEREVVWMKQSVELAHRKEADAAAAASHAHEQQQLLQKRLDEAEYRLSLCSVSQQQTTAAMASLKAEADALRRTSDAAAAAAAAAASAAAVEDAQRFEAMQAKVAASDAAAASAAAALQVVQEALEASRATRKQQAEEVAGMQQELLQATKLLRTGERESVAWEGLRKDYEAKEQQAQQVIEDLMLLVQQLRLQKAEESKDLKQKNKDMRVQIN
jgi:hypothetical protein